MLQSEMFNYFERGMFAEFFAMWEKHLPEKIRNSDSVAQKLEFYLNIFFAIYPITHNQPVRIHGTYYNCAPHFSSYRYVYGLHLERRRSDDQIQTLSRNKRFHAQPNHRILAVLRPAFRAQSQDAPVVQGAVFRKKFEFGLA